MTNLPYFLALNRMNKVGPRTVNLLLNRWPNLENMFKLNQAQLEDQGLTPLLAHTISNFSLDNITEDLKWMQAATENQILCWDSPNYPALLKEIPDPPIILYAQGHVSALEPPRLAIVGSRNPSMTGAENAKHFAKVLSPYGITIVSGLALGIDAQAHWGCLESLGQTIAVLGTGIDIIYPRRHNRLADKIREKGLIITEFPLKSPPIAGHFPRRNRIISGLSLCTLVIEAAIKSGSLITARMAMEQNRDVLAIPGSIHNPLARGCHYLLQQGAKLVTSVADVLEEFRLDYQQPLANKANLSLAFGNDYLVKCIGFEMTSIDQIILRSGKTVEQIIGDLARLEMLGVILSVPGGYIRCNYER
ncbi:MAG: DNA-protecting protein DprA [Legionella sp.]|nr:DNA-protecting protein DprA [Legionella sp.]